MSALVKIICVIDHKLGFASQQCTYCSTYTPLQFDNHLAARPLHFFSRGYNCSLTPKNPIHYIVGYCHEILPIRRDSCIICSSLVASVPDNMALISIPRAKDAKELLDI